MPPETQLLTLDTFLDTIAKEQISEDELAQAFTFLENAQEDLSANHNIALCVAAGYGHLKIVKKLLNIAQIAKDVDEALCDAAEYGHQEVVQELIKYASQDAIRTALRIACGYNHLSLVRFILNESKDANIFDKNVNKENALHLAVKYHDKDTKEDRLEIIRTILQDERSKTHMYDKDIYGRTPLEIALQKKDDDILRLLFPNINDFSSFSLYRKPFYDLSQDNIEEKLRAYLEVQGRENYLGIIGTFGQCNGLEFLYQIYASQGEEKENEYLTMLTEIAKWDKSIPLWDYELDPSLKNDFASLEDLFERFITAIVIAQGTSLAKNNLQLGYQYYDRAKQYELFKDPALNRKLVDQFKFQSSNYTQDQLAEFFAYFSCCPGLSIDLSSPIHTTGIYMTPDRKFHYYDPGNLNRIIFDSPEFIAEYIFKSNAQAYHNKISLLFHGYRFFPQSELIASATPPKYISPLLVPSPNGWNKLHHAVLYQYQDEIAKMMSEDPTLLWQRDYHGFTPIDFAIKLNNKAMITELISYYQNQAQAPKLSDTINFLDLTTTDNALAEYFLKQGWIKLNEEDKHGQTLLHCAIINQNVELVKMLLCYQELDVNQPNSDGLSPLMLSLSTYKHVHYAEELIYSESDIDYIDSLEEKGEDNSRLDVNREIVELLLSRNDMNVNQRNQNNQKTALMYAANNNVYDDILELLINNNADVTLQDNYGYTASNYAKANVDPKIMSMLDNVSTSRPKMR